jgi:hypothetical protein
MQADAALYGFTIKDNLITHFVTETAGATHREDFYQDLECFGHDLLLAKRQSEDDQQPQLVSGVLAATLRAGGRLNATPTTAKHNPASPPRGIETDIAIIPSAYWTSKAEPFYRFLTLVQQVSGT